ncbi:MAG: hypothetical protein IKL32_01915, partial [Alphaproteobacteria bacterium]|nr:hypothetical protein [Alphaproteobacteria bacterium]
PDPLYPNGYDEKECKFICSTKMSLFAANPAPAKPAAKKAPAKKTVTKPVAKKAPAKKTATKTVAKKAPAKKTTAKKK